MEETGTPNVRTHILLYPERYFMIKQTLKQQKKIQPVFMDHKLCHTFEHEAINMKLVLIAS